MPARAGPSRRVGQGMVLRSRPEDTVGMSADDEAVSALRAGDENAQMPPPASEAGPAGGDNDGRIPAAERRTWWFRSIIGIFVLFFLAIVGVAVHYLLKGGWAGWVTGGIILFLAVLFGVAIWLMALGYGWNSDADVEPGTPIPCSGPEIAVVEGRARVVVHLGRAPDLLRRRRRPARRRVGVRRGGHRGAVLLGRAGDHRARPCAA